MPVSGQIKSKKRVAEHGEVFTGEKEVKAMCDLVINETNQISSRFLEPACGDGNFLAEVLSRKLRCAEMRKYEKSPYDWERNSLLALASIYGVDILADNCETCRERLFHIWESAYKKVCKKDCNDDTKNAARFILARNIICGDALHYHVVDKNGRITDEPIIFSEWSFPRNDAFIYRKDYSFNRMVNGKNAKKKSSKGQPTRFADQESDRSDKEGQFICEYKRHYRRLGDPETEEDV